MTSLFSNIQSEIAWYLSISHGFLPQLAILLPDSIDSASTKFNIVNDVK